MSNNYIQNNSIKQKEINFFYNKAKNQNGIIHRQKKPNNNIVLLLSSNNI